MEMDGGQISNANVNEPVREEVCGKPYILPKETCKSNGRLIKLEQKEDIEDLDNTCKELIGRGGFGAVYKSDDVSDAFGMQIALKKIQLDENDENKSVEREITASRILHPFILPLLAVADRPLGRSEFWIVSPFFEKGNLLKAIGNKTIPLGEKDRVKILLQLATAIQYIHTKVPNVRNVTLHKDVSSQNVVLDLVNNARLIDFGLAREKDFRTSNAEGKLHYCHPDFGTGKCATECWDYYMFGVIVREMLTGLGPQGCNKKFLKKMTLDEVHNNIEKNKVWSQGNASVLNDIAHQCLQCVGWTAYEFKTNAVGKIERMWECFKQRKIFDVPDDYQRCHICMINTKSKESNMTQKHAANCQQNIQVCIACEKNCSINPITCYCGAKLTPLGSRWGALLVAGNDKIPNHAKVYTRDVKKLKNVLTSKAPRIFGISENNIRMVTPCSQDISNSTEQELLLPQIRENVKYFKEQTEIDTLLIYFTGHCTENEPSSFMLGSVSEIVTLAYFEEMLDALNKVDKLIIILDCCFPPKINFKKKNRKVIQINACANTEQARMTEEGGILTKSLIQCLKGKAERLGCSEDCKYCKEYFDESSDFITVFSLFEYLKNHIIDPVPIMIQDSDSDSSNIAYFTDEQVKILFTDMKTGERQSVQLDYLQDMEQLQIKLFEDFGKKKNEYNVKVQRDTFRKDKQFEDCDTIEKVMAAWVQRQPLIVQFESILNKT